MPFAYYARLTTAQQKTYRQSDRITTLALPPGVAAAPSVVGIEAALAAADRRATERHAQALADALVAGFGVPPLAIRVLAQRPSDDYGELHGLYDPREDAPPASITLWMRTAAKGNVVAFRSFLRTLVHEFCHHLDYEHFKLDETFHTEGFYKREASLANALFAAAGMPPPARKPV
ncbi:MAG: hypothetical protein JSR18_14865 [Proteobacteria bacterium]|nr:hypothetical protein [Pseudomonadota bacterium]